MIKSLTDMFYLSYVTLINYRGEYLLFFASLTYIFMHKEEKEKRFWGYFTLVALFIFFNPICAKIITKYCIEETVYWRYLWILPISLLIAYVGTKLIEKEQGKIAKGILLGLCTIVIIASGHNMFNGGNFTRAENIYKIPQDVVDICNVINQKQIEDKIALPEGLRYYVRQYDAGINVLYTRMIYHTSQSKLIKELEKPKPNAKAIDGLLNEEDCRYVIINTNEQLVNELGEYSFDEIGRTENYIIMQKK